MTTGVSPRARYEPNQPNRDTRQQVAAPYLGDRYITGLTVSSALWDLAFLAFVVLHARSLISSRR